jgi:hypothetical protein
MIEFRLDDGLLIGAASMVMQLATTLMDSLESAKVIPVGPSRLRGLFKRNFWLWLFAVVPSVLICMGAIWLCLRMVLPENIWLSAGIFASLFVIATGINIARLRVLRKSAHTHHEAAYQHLQEAETHLKSLAEGPMIVDEELDRKVLQLRKQIVAARDHLGVKENDPDNR